MKNLKWLALISVVVAVAIWPVTYAIYREFYVKPFLQSAPPYLRPYIDYQPFFSTWYGMFTLAVWVCIVSSWIAIGFQKIIRWYRLCKQKSKVKQNIIGVLLAIVLLLTVAFYCLNISKVEARWNVYNEVDVLMIGDEEFRAHSDWMENAENVLQDVSDNRFEESHILFYTRGWLDWDSLDSQTCTYSLMQEALAESGLPRQQVEIVPGSQDWGFISGGEWTDKEGVVWWIDLLIIFTGQDCNMRGFSPPMFNMTILRYDSVDLHIMTHELGHQYYLLHCSDPWCAMNVDWQFGDNFCADCRAQLNAKKDKWLTDPTVYFISHIDKGQFVSPVNYTDFIWGKWAIYFARRRCGTTVTVRAEPLEGWILEHYYARNTPWTYTQDPEAPPPPSFNVYESEFEFTLNDTWTIYALFTKGKINEVKLEGSDGNPGFKRGDHIEVYVSLTWLEEDNPMVFVVNITDSNEQTIASALAWCSRYIIGSSEFCFGLPTPKNTMLGEALVSVALWSDYPWEEGAKQYSSAKTITIEIIE